jgi:hypothetical protein
MTFIMLRNAIMMLSHHATNGLLPRMPYREANTYLT